MPTWYYVLGFALVILGFLLSLQGLWLTCRAIFSTRVLRIAGRCRTSPVASFFVGLFVTAVVALLGGIATAGGPVGKITAAVIWAAYFFSIAIGTSGFVTHIGQRLASPTDDLQPWRATLRGGIALSLSWLVPIFGWFLLPPFSFLMGVGALVLSFRKSGETNEAAMELPPLDLALSSRMSGQELPPEFRAGSVREGAVR